MKKLLFVITFISLLVLTGCGDDHGNYDLKCTGKYLFTTDVCFREDWEALSDNGKIDQTIDEVSLCGDVSNGTGEYYFYFEDGKVFIELLRHFLILQNSLEKKGSKSLFKCKKFDITDNFKNYNTKGKMKELLEDKLEYSCN